MKNSSSAFFFFSLVLFSTIFTSPLSANCNPNDQKVVLEIKAAFGNPSHLASWDPNVDCCDWSGLECDNKPPYRVTYIRIPNANVSGQIPAAVGDLPYLEGLVFQEFTNLTGTIPPSIANLTNLTDFVISNTNLSGPIPTFLTKLEKLTYLDLSFNDLTGSIPPELSQFKYIEDLHLEGNKLTGTIPESFGHFTGRIPEIFLSHNHLTGQVPKSLGELNLITIDFSGNNLTGDPSFLLGRNKTIRSLDLSRNNFTFDLTNVEFPAGLSLLNLNHNNINGRLPQQLTQLITMGQFNVSYNRLCGDIPQGGNLQLFDMYSYFHNRCLCGDPLTPCM